MKTIDIFRRSVQTIMINENMIKWLVPLLSKSNDLSDYTLGKRISLLNYSHTYALVIDKYLEYGVALLMNLCLRTEGRKKCAEITEQAINALASLLTHPNHEVCLHAICTLYFITKFFYTIFRFDPMLIHHYIQF